MFFSVSALIFAASAAVTMIWCASMSSMGGMTMPGGWTMSMTWMRMPGQSWTGAAASFLGMWMVMMIAMMLPSLIPMLMRYRQAVVATSEKAATIGAATTRAARANAAAVPRLGLLTMLAGSAYFFVWALFGMVIYPLGIALADIAMRQPVVSRAVPVAAAASILIAGVLQFTAWKARYLERCRQTPALGREMRADAVTAWRHGLRLGLHCCHACAGPMVILLVLGVMDLRVMAVVTAAIAFERFAPAGVRAARAIGTVIVAAGVFEMIQNLADLI